MIYKIFKKIHFNFRFIFSALFYIFSFRRENILGEFENINIKSHEIIILAPHFDDEILGCLAIIHNYFKSKKITIVYITDGCKGGMKSQNSEYKNLRAKESENAIKKITSNNYNTANYFLNLPDGEVSENKEKLKLEIGKLINETQTVFCPFIDDIHPDHKAVAEIVTELKAEKKFELYEYFVFYKYRSFITNSDNIYISQISFWKAFKSLYFFKSQIYIDFRKELCSRINNKNYLTFFRTEKQ